MHPEIAGVLPVPRAIPVVKETIFQFAERAPMLEHSQHERLPGSPGRPEAALHAELIDGMDRPLGGVLWRVRGPL